MKHKWLGLICGVLALCFSSGMLADTDYLFLGVPAQSSGNYPTFPIYVYQTDQTGKETQIDYVANTYEQIFLGSYVSGVTTATYQFYYQDTVNKGWYRCTFALSDGNIVAATTSCPGPVLVQFTPVIFNGQSIQPNAWKLGFGSGGVECQQPNCTDHNGIGWAPVPVPSPAPVAPAPNQNRTITFINNTPFKTITLGESCTTSAAPPCVVNNSLATIDQGASYVVNVGSAGLNSANFFISGYQNAQGEQVSTGGYSDGKPYANLMEFTLLPITNDGGFVSFQASNADTSAVNGFNFGFSLYPAEPTYCTYTAGPENSNALGVGYFSVSQPIAQLAPMGNLTFQQLCENSSQLSNGGSSAPGAWNLSVISPEGDFQGCYSPCQYASVNGYATSSDNSKVQLQAQYCCSKLTAPSDGSIFDYSTPELCNAAPALAMNSTYVKNLHANSNHVYTFAYDDSTGDFACPGLTNFVVSIVSTAQNPNTLSAPVITTPVTAVGTTANIAWSAAVDSNPGTPITYQLVLTSDDQPVHAQINYGTDSASVSGLQAGYSYKAIVTATDKNGAGSQQSQPSQPAYFTTTFFTAPTNVAITPTQTSAAITWTPSQDTYPNATIMYAATVSLTPGGDPAVPVVSSTSPSATVNGLTSSTQYYATIKATDTVNNLVASASPVPFTTTAAASLSQPQLSVVEHNSELGTVSWPHVTATGFNPGQLGTGNYTVSITGAPAVITNYSCDGSGCTVTFSRRSTQGDTVTVTAHAGDVTSLPASILVR